MPLFFGFLTGWGGGVDGGFVENKRSEVIGIGIGIDRLDDDLGFQDAAAAATFFLERSRLLEDRTTVAAETLILDGT
jgi:hypothetical protein